MLPVYHAPSARRERRKYIEQLPIPPFDGVVLAARTGDGQIHLSLRDLCATIGLDAASQRRHIRANESLHLTAIRVHIERQFRTLDFLPLHDLALWILTLQTARVHPESQSRISYIKQYLEASVRHAFTQLTGLPETSRQVEELRELDRLDRALELLEQLGARQTTIETSQDRARLAFRDLTELVRSVQSRVQALEAQAKLRLSTTQRGTIYGLVQTWGSARAERQKDQRSGDALRACWRLFNQRFGINTYTDLPRQPGEIVIGSRQEATGFFEYREQCCELRHVAFHPIEHSTIYRSAMLPWQIARLRSQFIRHIPV